MSIRGIPRQGSEGSSGRLRQHDEGHGGSSDARAQGRGVGVAAATQDQQSNKQWAFNSFTLW